MRCSRLVAPVLTPVLIAAGTLAATPAVAAPARPTTVVHTAGAARAQTSGSVAGYAAGLPTSDPQARHSFVGSFRVPRATCPQRPIDPLFVTVILFGTTPGTNDFAYVEGNLTVSCTQGVASYQATATSPGGRRAGAVSPNDLITVKLSAAPGRAIAELVDTTTGAVLRSAGKGVAATAVQASVQGGLDGKAFPRTTAVLFANVRADNTALGALAPTGIDQVDDDGNVVLRTSALDASGLRFTVARPA